MANALIAELGHDSKQQLTISTAISFFCGRHGHRTWAPVIWGTVPMMGRITAIRVTHHHGRWKR